MPVGPGLRVDNPQASTTRARRSYRLVWNRPSRRSPMNQSGSGSGRRRFWVSRIVTTDELWSASSWYAHSAPRSDAPLRRGLGREAIQPGLRLLGLADGLWPDRAA